MTSPIVDDGEDNWWDAPVGPRHGSVSGSAPGPSLSPTVAAAAENNRLGVLWLFSHVTVDEVMVWDMETRARSNAVIAPPTSWQIASDTIAGWVRDLVNYVKEKLAAAMKFLDDNGDAVLGGAYIGTLVVTVLEEVWPSWRDWAPVAGDAATGLQAIGQTFTACKALFDTWLTSACAAVVDGVPSVIVESLRSTMRRSALTGLATAISSGLKVSAAFMTAGASTLGEKIVGLIGKLVVKVVKLYMKHQERVRLQKFVREAKEHFDRRAESDAIQKDHKKFVDWYKPVALASPAIAALTLLSHACGDKIAYLAIYQDRLETLSQDAFSASVEALDALKPWARSYLNDCGFTFRSDDALVGRLLGFPDAAPTELMTTIMSASEASAITTRSRGRTLV